MKTGRVVIVFLFVVAVAAWGQAAGDAAGQALLDSHQWERAAQEFDRVAAQKGPQADSALYWRAYALNKAAFRGEALTALAELRRLYPMSRWLQDAAALEMEIERAAGQKVTPESQSDDELKLLALNGLMMRDSEHAVPAVESVLRQAQSPMLKRNALYVLAQSDSAEAQELMERVARGNVDPDLQVLGVRYLVQQRRDQGNLGKLLFEIYNSTADANVKQEAIGGLVVIGDTEHLAQTSFRPGNLPLPGSEQVAQLLGLMKAYTTTMQENGLRATDRATVGDYQAQKDRAARQGIIDGYASQRNTRALIAIARVETDPGLKRKIVEHLIDLNTPEAREYLLELLK